MVFLMKFICLEILLELLRIGKLDLIVIIIGVINVV